MVEIEHHVLQLALPHLSVRDPDAALGEQGLDLFAMFSMVSTSLWRKYTWPPRAISRTMARAQEVVVPLVDEGFDGVPKTPPSTSWYKNCYIFIPHRCLA